MGDLQVEYLHPSKLRAYGRNARTHSPEQVAEIAASIKRFGFANPVLVDASLEIIAGHGRCAAAARLGLTEVPVVRLAGLTEEQVKALRIADNRLALNAGWDEALLAQELSDLQAADFNLDALGFADEELAGLMSGLQVGAPAPVKLDDKSADTKPPPMQRCPKCGFEFAR